MATGPATTKAIIGKGTILGYYPSNISTPADSQTKPAAGSFTPFLEVKKTSLPKLAAARVKATHFTSPTFYHEYVPGWKDGGQVQFDANYIDSDRVVLEEMIGVNRWFLVEMPLQGSEVTPSTSIFYGFVEEVTSDVPNEEVCDTKVTIRLSGQPSFTAGS